MSVIRAAMPSTFKKRAKACMRNSAKLVVLALALSAAGAVIAQSACTLSLTVGSGTGHDWGTSTQTAWLARLDSSATASGPDYKSIGNLSHALNVNCLTSTSVALEFSDNAATAVPASNAVISSGPWMPTPFGVADVNNSNASMGMFLLAQNNVLVNGNPPGTKLRANNGTTTWARLADGSQGTTRASVVTPGYTYAFVPGSFQTAPVGISTLSGSLDSETYLSRSYVAGVTGSARFQSSVRITLRYF